LELMIAAGCDLDARNKQGETALMWAACNGKMDSAALLVSAGCDMDAVDGAGLDAVAWANSEQHWDVAVFIESERERRSLEGHVAKQGAAVGGRRI
jgi:ankyrin repeat protein